MSLHHAGHRGEREREARKRVEDLLLVLLHVLRIGERQALHHDEQRGQRADDAAGLGAHQLGGVGIALLRHDRGAGGEAVGEARRSRIAASHQSTISSAKRERCIGAIDAAASASSAKSRSETASSEFAVGRSKPSALAVAFRSIGKRGAGERRRAERRFVQPPAAIGEAAAVALKHLDIGEEMMAEGDRLRALQMREARHHGVGMRLGLRRPAPTAARGAGASMRVDRVAHPEAEVGRHLVVARARGMQPAGRLADQLLQPRLDIHVDVLERAREREVAGGDL